MGVFPIRSDTGDGNGDLQLTDSGAPTETVAAIRSATLIRISATIRAGARASSIVGVMRVLGCAPLETTRNCACMGVASADGVRPSPAIVAKNAMTRCFTPNSRLRNPTDVRSQCSYRPSNAGMKQGVRRGKASMAALTVVGSYSGMFGSHAKIAGSGELGYRALSADEVSLSSVPLGS